MGFSLTMLDNRGQLTACRWVGLIIITWGSFFWSKVTMLSCWYKCYFSIGCLKLMEVIWCAVCKINMLLMCTKNFKYEFSIWFLFLHVLYMECKLCYVKFGKCKIVTFISLPFQIMCQLCSRTSAYCVFWHNVKTEWCEFAACFWQ